MHRIPRWPLIICAFAAIATATIFLIWILIPVGYGRISTSMVDRPFEKRVLAPHLPMSGELYVSVSGKLDGDAILEVFSNKDRDHRQIHLGPGNIDTEIGGPEEWVGDLHVIYRPQTAKKGYIDTFLRCGAGYNQYQRWKTEQGAAANP